MATKPKVKTLTNSAVDVLNVIRNNAPVDFKNYVPVATADADSIKTIGAIIMDNPSLQNEFLSALVNRIGLVIVTSKMYSNPLSVLKKGVLEFGETIEEIFVNIAKPFTFDPEEAEDKQFKREIPDVKSAFHILNYQKFYKVTISDDQLRQAFLSWAGISDLIAKIVDSMYTAAEYDELEVTKYMLARQILDGRVYAVTIPEVTTPNMKSVVSTVKGISNKLTFMSSNYNVAGVKTHTQKNEQYIIMNANFDATMDVEVLASAFNMDKAQFMGNRLMIDGFGTLDTARLAELFAGDSTYQEINQTELEALDKIPCILIDRNYAQIYDNMYKMTEKYNGQGLYWNYYYHTWKTFSVSPFSQAVVFVPAIPSVTSVTVTPSTATVSVGQTVQLTAKVETENFAPQTVTWSSDSKFATVTAGGLVTILEGATGTINITAKSTFNPDISDQSVLTVG
jgi:hypothetical protein